MSSTTPSHLAGAGSPLARALARLRARARGAPASASGAEPATLRGVVALLAVLAFLVLGGLSHDGRRALDRELASGTFRATPLGLVRAVRAYLANEDDMYRCHAYASAILGRPYRSYFVRSRADWEASFARGVAEDPDATPIVRPRAPLRPYRDFLLEYPPGFLLVLIPPALVTSSPDGYARVFKATMAACLLLSWLAAERLARALDVDVRARGRLPGAMAAAVLALGVVCTHRYDAFVAACMVLGVLEGARGRAVSAGLWLGVAVSAKGVPLLVVPLVAASLARELGRAAALRMLAAVAAIAGGSLLAAVSWCGRGVLAAFVYHGARPVQIESTWGALLAVAAWFRPGLITVVHSYSSRNLRGPPVELVGAIAAIVAAAAVAVSMSWLLWRLRRARSGRARLAAVIDGAVVLLAAYMGLGKVFCPQYLVWILPFALLASRRPGRWPRQGWVFLLLLIATQIIYPLGYPAVKALAPWASLLVLARDVALLAWAVTLLGEGRHSAPAEPPAAPLVEPPLHRSVAPHDSRPTPQELQCPASSRGKSGFDVAGRRAGVPTRPTGLDPSASICHRIETLSSMS